jgi:hypothetical protein
MLKFWLICHDASNAQLDSPFRLSVHIYYSPAEKQMIMLDQFVKIVRWTQWHWDTFYS